MRALIDEAAVWFAELLAPGSFALPSGAPAPFVLLMGSGAVGEAVAAPLADRLLPLSDLDLGLFLPRGLRPGPAQALARSLHARLAPLAASLGLTTDPVDLGIFALPTLRGMSPTLELCEASARPHVIAGDATALRGWCPAGPPPFEAARLALNRVVEAGALPAAPVWPATPAAEDWRRAHRIAKLPVDLLKALMAARGRLYPSVEQRAALAPEELAGLPPACLGAVRDWSAWRLAPSWPPPAAPDAGAMAALTRAVIERSFAALAGRPIDLRDRRDLHRLLAAEAGPLRERTRRWVRLLHARPPDVALPAAALAALRWSASGVWPGSLSALVLGLTWLATAGAAPGSEAELLRGLAGRARGENSAERAERMVHWVRSAGA